MEHRFSGRCKCQCGFSLTAATKLEYIFGQVLNGTLGQWFWYCVANKIEWDVKKTQWLNKIKSQKVVLGIWNVYDPRCCLVNPNCYWQFAYNMDTILRSILCYMFCTCKLRFAYTLPQFLVWFGIFFNGISTFVRLFNAKAILEEQ